MDPNIWREPPALLITPKVAVLERLVPGAPKIGVLVAPMASMRIWNLRRSRMGNCLSTVRLRLRVEGARNSERKAGSGVMVN